MGGYEREHAGARPEVVAAAQWGAAAPTRRLAPRGPLDHLVVHHSAFPSAGLRGRAAEIRHVREIERWHLARGFSAIGYHFLIAPSGRVFRGRPLDRAGAHVQGHNRGTVGICLLGDFERERPTEAALGSLAFVRGTLVPGGASVPLRGHREHSGHETNLCPGRRLLEALRNVEGPPGGGPSPNVRSSS